MNEAARAAGGWGPASPPPYRALLPASQHSGRGFLISGSPSVRGREEAVPSRLSECVLSDFGNEVISVS